MVCRLPRLRTFGPAVLTYHCRLSLAFRACVWSSFSCNSASICASFAAWPQPFLPQQPLRSAMDAGIRIATVKIKQFRDQRLSLERLETVRGRIPPGSRSRPAESIRPVPRPSGGRGRRGLGAQGGETMDQVAPRRRVGAVLQERPDLLRTVHLEQGDGRVACRLASASLTSSSASGIGFSTSPCNHRRPASPCPLSFG